MEQGDDWAGDSLMPASAAFLLETEIELDNDHVIAVPTLGPIMIWVMMLLMLLAGQYGLKRL